MMKRFLIGSVFALGAVAAFAGANAYNVLVETYVGGKLEDKFEFVVREDAETPQEKGYDGKYLAKRYLAKGFLHEHPSLSKKPKKDEAAPEKTVSERVEVLLFELRKTEISDENALQRVNASVATTAEKRAQLEAIAALGNSKKAEKMLAEYLEKYAPSKQDLEDAAKIARFNKIKYRDYEEYNIGSYCRMYVKKVVDARTVQFVISYAYSRLLTTAYHDGMNTDNAITKYPVFEIFERLSTPAKITLGKPYCIQFGRPESAAEAKTIQDAIAKTRLFSGADVAGSSEASAESSSDDADGGYKYEPRTPLDKKGSFEKLSQKYALETPKTVRAVFTVTPVKQH